MSLLQQTPMTNRTYNMSRSPPRILYTTTYSSISNTVLERNKTHPTLSIFYSCRGIALDQSKYLVCFQNTSCKLLLQCEVLPNSIFCSHIRVHLYVKYCTLSIHLVDKHGDYSIIKVLWIFGWNRKKCCFAWLIQHGVRVNSLNSVYHDICIYF